MNNLFTSISSLQKKSSSVMNVFNKTIEDLKKINEIALTEVSNKTIKIQTLEKENKELNTIVSENSKVISKIQQFFN